MSLHQAGQLFAQRLNSRAEARAALVRAVEATEDRDRLLLEDLAYLDEVAGEHADLVRVLEVLVHIIAEPSEKVEALHRMGQVLETRLSDEDTAVRGYQAALSIDPAHVPTLRALGSLLARRGDWVELIEMLLREAEAVDETRRRALAHARIAEILDGQLHRPAEAADHFARALSLAPDHRASFRALTRLYAHAGRFRDLVELYEQALDQTKSESRRVAYLFKIGSILEDSLGDPSNAAHAYRRVLEIEPRNLIAIHAMQRVTEAAGRWDELVEVLELEADETDDDELVAALLHRAGTVLEDHLDNREGAITRFRKVLALQPDNASALSSLGRLFYRAGRWDDLLGVYERELDSQPDRPDAVIMLYKMGELCETRLGRDQDAIDYYRKAAELDHSYRPAITALTRKLRERDDWDQLAEVYELEISGIADPRAKAFALWSAGAVYEERLDKPDQAMSCYERARKIEPDFWPATLALARLRSEKEAWRELVGDLERVGRGIRDEVVAGAAMLRQGAIWRDYLHDSVQAIRCFESLMRLDTGKLPALFDLEVLYSDAEAWDALAHAYAMEAESVSDPAARVAALRELARVQETKSIGSLQDVTETYEAILAAAPDDQPALLALHRLASSGTDDLALATVCRRLGKATGDPELAARYLARMGHVREVARDPGAISAYRTALDEDPACLTAIRGLARTAEAAGDDRSLAEAWRREADVVRDPRAASELLVKSAVVRLDELEDADNAMRDLERALDLWPDSQVAAERLCNSLLHSGRVDYLIGVLSRAAGSVREPAAAAAHWLRISEIRYEHLQDLPGALTALDRSLSAAPDHVPALRMQGELYRRDRRYRDAVAAYQRTIELTPDPAAQWLIHVDLAEIYREHLDEPDLATASLDKALELGDPNDPSYRHALANLADLHVASGDSAAAAKTAKRMVETAATDDDRSAALVYWASIEISRSEIDRAERALAHAVALTGSTGDGARSYYSLVEHHGRNWAAYVKGLTAYVQRQAATYKDSRPDLRRILVPEYLELAQIHEQRMGLPRNAIANLEEGMALTGRDPTLARHLIPLLRQVGRHKDAVTLLRKLLAVDVADPEVWRGLVDTLDQMNRPAHAEIHLAPLVILGAATDEDRARLKKRGKNADEAPPASFNIDLLRTITDGDTLSCPGYELLSTIAEAVGKIHPPDLETMGLSRRDRLSARSRHPLRGMADQIAEIFDIEYDLYVHQASSPAVTVELTEPPAIIVAEHVGSKPEAEQIFLLAYAMAPIAGRFHAADKLSPTNLQLLLAAATRSEVAGFGDELPGADALDQTAVRLRKAVPRKLRKAMDAAAQQYAADKLHDFAAWQSALDRTAMRAALLLTGDLAVSVSILRNAEDLGGLTGPELLRSSSLIADLVRFWASDKALTARREAGLVA